MKDNFDACLKFTLAYEGGYVNHPADPGGATKYGITRATLSHELGRAATIADVKNLTIARAGAIYRKKYWALIGGDALPAGVDLMGFDIAVNSGPGLALQWLGLTKQLPAPERVAWLHDRRMRFYRGLKTFSTFGKGWTRRETACFAVASQMAGARKAG